MSGFLRKFLIGPSQIEARVVEGGYRQQCIYLQKLWQGHTFGIERLLRLTLCMFQFIYPTLLVRSISCRFGRSFQKLVVEAYIVLFKLLFPVVILIAGWYRYPPVIIFVIYLLSETIVHIMSLIFLSDIYNVSISYRRSILFLFIHYIEVILDFSTIYLAFDLLNAALTPISAVYFSFVTNTTLGFGEIHPQGIAGQIVVICQLIIFIMFVFLFVNYFSFREHSSQQ